MTCLSKNGEKSERAQMFEKLRRQLGLPELQMYWKAQRDKTNDLCDVRLAYNPLRKVLLHNKNAKSRGS